MKFCRFCCLAAALLHNVALLALSPSAHAWGCKGHQVIALIAESRMTPHAYQSAVRLLKDAPMGPNLPRYCGPKGLDAFADASTWADDVRKLRPGTSPWHFIDIPLGAAKRDMASYCPPETGCVTSALNQQLAVLRDSSATPQARADALRFLIHFVGDVHQPLHAASNNDLGGNCVPVTFFGHAPEESPPGSGSFHPNLHSVWDTDIVEHLSRKQPSFELARDLQRKFRSYLETWQTQPANFAAWAWESHELAERVVYRRLPHPLPIEGPRPMTACPVQKSGPSHAGRLQIDENLAEPYQNAAAPFVEEQLAKAGVRLAALLDSLWQ